LAEAKLIKCEVEAAVAAADASSSSGRSKCHTQKSAGVKIDRQYAAKKRPFGEPSGVESRPAAASQSLESN
jgi:hypothetical protein